MTTFTEKKIVQNRILEILSQLDWQILDLEEANSLRGESGGLFLQPILIEKLKGLNPGVMDLDGKAEEMIKRLEDIKENISGNEEAFSFLRGEKTTFLEKESREANVKFLDFENPENNIFQAVKELTFTGGDKGVRFDIVLFINGIPVGIIETKGPETEEPIEEGFAQVKRYHKEAREFLKLVQFYCLSEGINFFYGASFSLIKKNLYRWKSEKNDFKDLCQTFFSPKQIISILEDYTVFFREEEKITKIILKPHQIKAVEKLVERVRGGKKKHGLFWHTQGSGKTLTMIVAAHRLRRIEELENPTILVLVDRIELEQQMKRNLEAFGFPNLYVAKSKENLQNMLTSDRRGLIISTIQKFGEAKENLNNRENIIILVDEAHRSQEGNLGNYLRRALPNAFCFGFTGTPIDKGSVGKGTFLTFGYEDKGGYTDKYSIVESIKDGTTVPLYYTFAEQDLRVNKELLEKEFFEVAEKEGITSIESLNRILEKAVRLREFLKSPERIRKISQFVAKHFQESIEPLGFKAFLVAVDREACALYKEEIDNYLPPEYSKAVYSKDQKDGQLLKQFYLGDSEEKQLKIDFRYPEKLPKIFIVTGKLLTGYDAPILFCMYLDKPMKDHALLQAIARINRPFEDARVNRKTAGLIVDFVGVFENLKKALSFDSKTIEGAVKDISLLKQLFVEGMKQTEPYIKLAKKAEEENKIDGIIEYFVLKPKREKFIDLFKKIQDLYEIISPDKFLGRYIEDYNRLVSLYKVLINAFTTEPEVDKKLLRKTKELMRKYTTAERPRAIPVYIIDENILERVKKEKTSDVIKIIGVGKSITIYIDRNKIRQPYLIPLGEAVETILEKFRNQQLEAKAALEKLLKLASDITQSEKIRGSLGLNAQEFSIYWVLEQAKIAKENTVNLAKDLMKEFENFPFWADNPEQERELRLKLYSLLGKYAEAEKMIEIVNKVLEIFKKAKHEGKS